MKYYIIAGEASGDLHAANLMKEIKLLDHEAIFRAWGGDLMKEQGATLVKHYRDLAFMGFIEVILNIRSIKENFKICKSDMLDFIPDLLILVDYPGFNLRMAKFAHEKKLKTYYYISPKIWAWKKSRAYKIKHYIDKMFVIFPFEKDFYKTYNYSVEYCGNPLLDEIEKKKPLLLNKTDFLKQNKLENRPIIALLAGSRKQEINHILPEMLKMLRHFPEFQFVIAVAPSFNAQFYQPFIENLPVKLVINQTYDLLKNADFAIVTSGTATLETALFNIPQIVVYKMQQLQYDIGKFFIKVKYFSLVNIIMNSEVVKELLQNNLEQLMKLELNRLIHNTDYRNKMLKNYETLKLKLGETGASRRTAEIIVKDLISNN